MKYLPILSALFLALLSSCGGGKQQPETAPQQKQLFKPVTNTFDNQDLVVPEGAQVDILFAEHQDSVIREDGQIFPTKGKQDFLAYFPINGSSEHGYLFVNHELRDANPDLGDGGGMSWMEVKLIEGHWQRVGMAKSIDFSSVGGTWHNCGGTVTPHGTILTAEEYPEPSNKSLYADGKQINDTSDFDGLKRHELLGWMVEVDPVTKKPINRLYSMGRYSHEDAHCMADGKTVYLTDDYNPSVFYKFVADSAGDYTAGQLYAYKMGENGTGGEWLTLPRERDSLVYIRDIALRMGATSFLSHEWIDEVNGKIYITESGSDGANLVASIEAGSKPASYLGNNSVINVGGGAYKDPYGRVLEFDPATNTMREYLAGGMFADSINCFAKVDGLISVELHGKPYLVICEDGSGKLGRVSKEAEAQGETYNEIYFLDMTIANPTREDLLRFCVGPRGCEMTGPVFTPDKKTFFFVVQGPDRTNQPFNKTSVVAVTGIF